MTIYRQYDSRWSGKPYPNSKSLFGGNGCGCCAVLHLLLEKNPSWTPETIRPYMVSKGYAVQGQGTTWGGITETMKHYGLANVVQYWDFNTNMTKTIADCNKGGRMGIILFSGGSAGSKGTVWTTGGHYVAFTDYKVVGNKHYFYMKDSGARKHDGWFSYEENMRGKVSKVYVCDKPKPTVKKAYTGTFPTLPARGYFKSGDGGAKGSTNVKNLQKLLNWINGGSLVIDGKIGAKTISAVKTAQKKLGVTADGLFGKTTLAKAKAYKK